MEANDWVTREHENLLEWLRVCVSQMPDSVIRERRGVALIGCSLPFSLFNRVLITRPDASTDELAAAVATMRQRGEPFLLDLRRGVDDTFVQAVVDTGLVVDASEPPVPGMALAPIPPRSLEPPSLEISRVTDQVGLDQHIEALVTGFSIPDGFVRPVMAEAMLEREDLAIYVGLVEGEPLVSGFGVRTGPTIGVYNIATVPSARGRGYGAAMTARVAADGAAAGCDVAVLQASQMGFPIYDRMGYRTVVEYDSYAEPEIASTTPGA